jgi:hypothetical protein
MEILCVLCSMGWLLAMLSMIGFAVAAKVPGKVGDAVILAMVLGFVGGMSSCAAEERVCEIAGLEADP